MILCRPLITAVHPSQPYPMRRILSGTSGRRKVLNRKNFMTATTLFNISFAALLLHRRLLLHRDCCYVGLYS